MAGDTIYALASPVGAAPRAVLRLSGPALRAVLETCCALERPLGPERAAIDTAFDDGEGKIPLLLLWMPAPRSFTREDVAELHLVSSAPLVAAVIARLCAAGLRQAQAGEFTRRAVSSGRIDLARAQAVLAMVEAGTKDELRRARALMFSGASAALEGCREALEIACTLGVARLDFDPLDTGEIDADELHQALGLAERRLQAACASLGRARGRPERPSVVLAGLPSAGKSSLFNALVGGTLRARALVDAVAGTTRDALEAVWRAGELECTLVDVAGIDEVAPATDAPRGLQGEVTRAAQERALERVRAADCVLWVIDAQAIERGSSALLRALELVDEEGRSDAGQRWIAVFNKLDLDESALERAASSNAAGKLRGACAVSAKSGRGLEGLQQLVAASLSEAGPGTAQGEASSTLEQGLAFELVLDRALEGVQTAQQLWREGHAPDLVVNALLKALERLSELDGANASEDVLDRVFARFCLGK